ncbi:uncharacterized protein [Rutidosis leptorrhynchoides]|uniref:uncharacterized protein n=1 Tax=Rutidosis leptorrhynchoides TaxID=125765 RepID=UPI003A990F2B
MNKEFKIATWNIRGMSSLDKQFEVKNLINDEVLSMCIVLETHLKNNNISQACANAFNKWEWHSNISHSPNSCRIVVGWDENKVHVMILNCTKQVIFYLVEVVSTGDKIYCFFVYACNKGKDKVVVWKDLQMPKSITYKKPWFIMGDFNVTRYLNEHSSGSSMMTEDMKEFNACINDIEIEDINSSGFHFTWTKSLKNPRCRTLKKLDRIMINDEVMNSIPQAHGVFLPYIISDHSHAILCIPNFMVCKPKSFRFMNFTADKEAFQPIVEKGWSTQHVGCAMFFLIMKLKGLKKDLKDLTWVNGDIIKRVKELKEKLKDMQAKIDVDAHDVSIRAQATQILNDYETAKHDAFLILQQKTKIKWLSEGDKNTKYFHKVLKCRKQKAKVESIFNENDTRFYGDEVADQFVTHFQNFLGKTDSVKPIDELGNIFSVTLEANEANAMIIEVSNAEIKNAIFDIDGDKAAGPDGYSFQFLKKV